MEGMAMKILLISALLLSTPAWAKEVTVTLTDDDQNTIVSALNDYQKTEGLSVTMKTAIFLQKLQAAAAALPPAPTPLPDPKKP